jgi:PAS domain S-box-containing protein
MAADLERWFLAISGARDGVWDWFPDTGALYLSDQSRELIGMTEDDLAGNAAKWMDSVYAKDVPRIQDAIRYHWHHHTPQYTCEYRIRHRSGHYLWILSRGRATFDEEGRVVRMTGMHTNVTQRVLLEQNLQARTREMNTVLDLSPDGFVAINRKGLVQYVSPAFGRMSGLAQAELIKLPEPQFWSRLQALCPPDTDLWAMLEAHHSSTMRTKSRGVRFVLGSPTRRVLEVVRSNSEGVDVATLLHFRDVSLESEVERMKSEFLANAAHELRTPLASIHGFSEVLLTQTLDESARMEFTGIVHKQSAHMTELLNELLDLARIEARRGTDFVLRTQDIRTTVMDIVRSFKVPAGRTPPVCTVQETPLFARIDTAKIRQAVLNVLSNAYKYSPHGGDVLVTVEPFHQGSEMVQVAVVDHGIGMGPSVLSRLFERFFRADTSGRVPGTGLGLSIVKEIIELHQGEVGVVSQPGKATRVALRLPRVFPGTDAAVTVPAEFH